MTAASVLEFLVGSISDTLATDVRAARRALWSSVHHMLVLKLKLKLPLSWRVTTKVFSSDIGIDSEADSPPLSPLAEHPRLGESWVDSHKEPSL